MLGNRQPDKQFEYDIKLIRARFSEIMLALPVHERKSSSRLRSRIRHAIRQLRLCRDLASSLDRMCT